MNRDDRFAPLRRAVPVVITATGAVLALALAPPLLDGAWRDGVYGAFSFVCHQLPDRTPRLAGTPVAVCHRCLGLYAALPLGALVLPLLGRHREAPHRYAGPLLAAAVAVPGVDWALGAIGVWANTPLSRMGTGAVLGFVAGLVLTGTVVRTMTRRAARAV